MLPALVFGAVVAAVFPLLFDIPNTSDQATRILVLLIATDLAISIPSDTFGNTLMALQRYDLINVTLIVVMLAQAAAWAIVIALDGGLVALGIVTVVLSLAGQLSRFLLVRRLLGGVSLSPRLVDRERVRPLAGLSVWYALAQLSTLVISRLDVVVVGLVVGVPEAAVYAVGQKLAALAYQAIDPIVLTFFPHSSALVALREGAALRSAILTGTRVSMAVAARSRSRSRCSPSRRSACGSATTSPTVRSWSSTSRWPPPSRRSPVPASRCSRAPASRGRPRSCLCSKRR